MNDEARSGSQISESDKTIIQKAVQDTLDWLEANPQPTKEKSDEKYHLLEQIVHPIFSKLRGGNPESYSNDDGMPSHDEL